MTESFDALEVHEIATLFPSMSQVDEDHLRESLAKEGQLEEILVFEGKILDGRHRYAACRALGIAPRLRVFEGTAQEAFAYSVALNLSRRHLTPVQRAAAGAGIKEFQARLLAQAAAGAAPAEAAQGEPAQEDAGSAGEVEPAAAAPGPIDVSIEERDAAPPAEPPAPRRAPSARTINARARELASKRVGISGRAIEAAAKVKEEAPDVFERMLAGTAGSMPDVKRLTALPPEVREQVHALLDEGADLKAALKQVAPPPPADEGAVFVGKVVLEPAQATAFHALLEARGLKRAEAAREALLDWIAKHEDSTADARELVSAP